jgi:molybdate transport system substrate-binding protein
MRRLLSLLCGLIVTVSASAALADGASEPRPVLVAAASDLKFALDEILLGFRAETGLEARVTYGSSGNFARQIAQGAPFELFLSADERLVESLTTRELTRGAGELYAIGRIVVFAPRGSPLVPDPRLENLARRLSDGSLARFAIANPRHAPYGRAAEQALRAVGLWETVQPRLVLGENIAQAAQFAAGGSTEGGIIAYSLALAPSMRERGSFALIPDTLHEPLRQRMVLLRGASPAAERLYAYMRSTGSREILSRYGFLLPAE